MAGRKSAGTSPYGALRAVLHALRDRLTVEDTVHRCPAAHIDPRCVLHRLGSQPGAVKLHREEFLTRVRREFPYEVEGGMEPLVDTVLKSLRLHVTDGEWHEVKSMLPKDLATVLP